MATYLDKCAYCINIGSVEHADGKGYYCKCADKHIYTLYDEHDCDHYMFYD